MQPDPSLEGARETSDPPESLGADSARLAENEKELVEARRALVESSRAIRRLEAELEGARDAVRRSLGVEVHDDLGQLLTGVAFLAQGLLNDVPEPLVPAARRLLRLVNQSIERAHEIAGGLSPVPLPGRSLSEHLAELARVTTQTFEVECTFVPAEDFPVIAPDAVAHLHSIAREAVANAVRHATGTRVTIELAHAGGLRALTVRDNGSGLPRGSRPDGLGVRNMEHRASLLGGTLEVRNAGAGGGVEVRCVW
jgi:signal transduction histidine kinase